MMILFPLPTASLAAFGVVYKSDPTPHPSLREGLSAASGKRSPAKSAQFFVR